MKKILVVGGAGYIGSHMCKKLSESGYLPIVLDDLSRGHAQAVKWGSLVKGNMDDKELLSQLFTDNRISAVMHFAAYINVGESVTDPVLYYRNNVGSTVTLLKGMIDHGVKNFIFSSTAAVYGEPLDNPIFETHQCVPVNPYGRSKLMVEAVLKDFSEAYGLNYISLRYFNAAGADPDGEIGEDHDPETHIIPLVLKTALGQRKQVNVFGDDYPTRDGTCVRDYIHIYDLASAHLLALEGLLNGLSGGKYNLGNGVGYTVKEIIDVSQNVTGEMIPSKVVSRRPGDPATLIGSGDKAIKELGWKPRFADLETIIETAWGWHKKHPEGYNT